MDYRVSRSHRNLLKMTARNTVTDDVLGRRPSNSAVAGPQAVTTSSGDDAHNQSCDVAATVASFPTYGLFRLGDSNAYGR